MSSYRKIWRDHTGLTIPPGWHIHHIDGNHSNNDPENLNCLSPTMHWWAHWLRGDPVYRGGNLIFGAIEAGKRNAKLHFTPERQSKYGKLGPIAQLAKGTHNSQNFELCSKTGKKVAALGKSGFKQKWIRTLGQKASGRSKTREQLSALGKKGGKNSAASPKAFWKTGGLARAAAKSPNSVNKRHLKCLDHNIIGTIPGMKRYHKNCNLVEVNNVTSNRKDVTDV